MKPGPVFVLSSKTLSSSGPDLPRADLLRLTLRQRITVCAQPVRPRGWRSRLCHVFLACVPAVLLSLARCRSKSLPSEAASRILLPVRHASRNLAARILAVLLPGLCSESWRRSARLSTAAARSHASLADARPQPLRSYCSFCWHALRSNGRDSTVRRDGRWKVRNLRDRLGTTRSLRLGRVVFVEEMA